MPDDALQSAGIQPALRNVRLRKRTVDQDDAQAIGELASRSLIHVADRLLRSTDKSIIRPGDVFVMRSEPGKRCTDGLRGKKAPSSSKRDGFLSYCIPDPPQCDATESTGRAPWIRKRARITVKRADGESDCWEISAYDYDKPRPRETDHGQHFRTLGQPIDDLLLAAPDNGTATELRGCLNDHYLRGPSSPLSPRVTGLPLNSHRSLSPSVSPVMSKREQNVLFPHEQTAQLPIANASLTRYHPYVVRRDPYDHYMISRLHPRSHSHSWASHHH